MCLVSGRQRAREGAIEAVGKLTAAENEKDEDTLHDDAMPQHVVAGCALRGNHRTHAAFATGNWFPPLYFPLFIRYTRESRERVQTAESRESAETRVARGIDHESSRKDHREVVILI